MTAFVALIVPLGAAPGVPTHPIAPGGGGPVDPSYGVPQPPGVPTHPIYNPPGIWPNPGHPAHPIAPGGSPPGIWGGGNQPFPTPPIVIPPTMLPDLPEHIWGPNDPRPTPPIYLPTPEPPEGSLIDWKAVWTEPTGWFIVGVPNVPAPAPSKR